MNAFWAFLVAFAAIAAGHVVDGQVGGRLCPEHASCNFAAGARLGNSLRAFGTSVQW